MTKEEKLRHDDLIILLEDLSDLIWTLEFDGFIGHCAAKDYLKEITRQLAWLEREEGDNASQGRDL